MEKHTVEAVEHLPPTMKKGLVSRQIFAEVSPRVEYAITSTAHGLKPVLEELFRWWHESQGFKGLPPTCDG
jgi:DNA-binding HxlR family transcriptional regulator